MHDPCTVAHEVRGLFTIWHVDPERDGSDDSCDWFGGRKLTDKQKATRDRIASAFAFEWNRGEPYERFGWFMPTGVVGDKWRDGEPNYTSHAIVLAMFRIAANEHFGYWSKRAARFLRRHIFDILMFAENSCDSLCTDIEQKHGPRDGNTKEQAKRFASVVYGWILRADRPWWKHPRWHFWHWRIQFHPWQRLRRRWWDKCCICGKRGFKGAAIGNWDGDRIWHSECERVTVKAVDPSEIIRRTGT